MNGLRRAGKRLVGVDHCLHQLDAALDLVRYLDCRAVDLGKECVAQLIGVLHHEHLPEALEMA